MAYYGRVKIDSPSARLFQHPSDCVFFDQPSFRDEVEKRRERQNIERNERQRRRDERREKQEIESLSDKDFLKRVFQQYGPIKSFIGTKGKFVVEFKNWKDAGIAYEGKPYYCIKSVFDVDLRGYKASIHSDYFRWEDSTTFWLTKDK